MTLNSFNNTSKMLEKYQDTLLEELSKTQKAVTGGLLGLSLLSGAALMKSKNPTQTNSNISKASEELPLPPPIAKPSPLLKLQDLPPNERVSAFIDYIKPIVEKINNQIFQERKELGELLNKKDYTFKEDVFISELARKYNTKPNVNDLLKRVDVIPTNLAVAQAALESGWGTSLLAQNDNSLFGQKAAKDSNDFGGYESIRKSILSYMHNINTNRAYENFRNLRTYMRVHGQNLNPYELAKTLVDYDPNKNYTEKLVKVIKLVSK